MSDDDSPKPLPVRETPEPARGKPTPVRELSGEPPPAAQEIEQPEASFEVDGDTWTARVLGRSGGTAGTAPPLLLLGFWKGEADGDPSREALVVGSTLAALGPAALEEALETATAPPDRDRKKPFFEEAGQARRR